MIELLTERKRRSGDSLNQRRGRGGKKQEKKEKKKETELRSCVKVEVAVLAVLVSKHGA